ncbi:MAG: hypothetical protein JXR03_00595 [Cyclobacteriaceae bacterium]
MKNWIIILLTLIVLNSFGQNRDPKELGIGFAIPTNPYEFEDMSTPQNLYKNKEMTDKWNSNNVYPFFLKPDYGLYHFICLEKTNDYYKILVNDNEVGYIPNDSSYYFKTWDAILLQSTIARLTKNNLIRNEWNDDSGTIINNCEFDRLTVEDVIQKDGEFWLQIYFSPECEDYPDNNSKVEYGWIKWRTENKLLVNILLLC